MIEKLFILLIYFAFLVVIPFILFCIIDFLVVIFYHKKISNQYYPQNKRLTTY